MAEGTGYKPSGRAGLQPDPIWWMEQIRKGMEDRNKKTYRAKWETWRRWYRGVYGPKDVPVNLYFKMLRTMVPRVYFRNPSVSITPRKRQQGQLDYWIFSQLLEQADNALFDRIHLKTAMKKAIQDAFMFSTGIVKLGYGGRHTPTPDPIETSEPGVSKKGQMVEYNSYILPEMPWLLRVPTGRFIVPQHSLDWQSCRWAGHEERRHITDVKDDPRFKHTSDMNPGVLIAPGDAELNKVADQVSMVEIRDKKTGQVFVIAPSQKDKILAIEDDELQFDARLPYFPIQFNPDDDSFWAVSDAQVLEPHQVEINSIRRAMKMHRRISLIKYLVREGSIKDDELTKLLSPDEIGAVIKVDKDAVVLSDVLKEIQAGDLPGGLLKMDQMEQQLVQEILGMGVNQFGEYAPGSADRSATEAMIVNQAVQVRTDERRDICADVIVDITEHMNHVILNRWTGEQIVPLIGPEGQEIWTAFKMSEIKALEYDVKVDPDSSVPETRQVRRQFAQQTKQLHAQDPNIDQQKMTRWELTESGGPQLVDLMINGGKPLPQQGMLGAPGTPGASPQQPMPVANLINELAKRKQAAGGGIR